MPVQTPFAQDKKYSITARCKKSKGEDTHVVCVLSCSHLLVDVTRAHSTRATLCWSSLAAKLLLDFDAPPPTLIRPADEMPATSSKVQPLFGERDSVGCCPALSPYLPPSLLPFLSISLSLSLYRFSHTHTHTHIFFLSDKTLCLET